MNTHPVVQSHDTPGSSTPWGTTYRWSQVACNAELLREVSRALGYLPADGTTRCAPVDTVIRIRRHGEGDNPPTE